MGGESVSGGMANVAIENHLKVNRYE